MSMIFFKDGATYLFVGHGPQQSSVSHMLVSDRGTSKILIALFQQPHLGLLSFHLPYGGTIILVFMKLFHNYFMSSFISITYNFHFH